MRILLTGAGGFLGKAMLARLRQELLPSDEIYATYFHSPAIAHSPRDDAAGAPAIYPYRIDLAKPALVQAFLWSVRPDVIFHLAADSSNKHERPLEKVSTNVLGTASLLECAPEGCRFVLASSATVYGDNTREFDLCHSFPQEDRSFPSPTSVYGATKVASEALLEAYCRLGRVNGISCRLVAQVGPGATHGLLRDIVRKLRSDEPVLNLFGDSPGSVKPYMHVADTAQAMFCFGVQCRGEPYEVVNVSPGDSLSVLRVAEIAMREMGIEKEIVWHPHEVWPGDNPLVFVSDRLMRSDGRIRQKPPGSAEAIASAVRDMTQERD